MNKNDCEDAYDRGWHDYKDGKGSCDNPYNQEAGDGLYESWMNGFINCSVHKNWSW